MSYYAVLALVGLLLLFPIFYFSLLQLYIDDVDEALILRKDEFHQYHLPTMSVEDLTYWNRFNRDTQIFPTEEFNKEYGIQDAVFYDTLSIEWEPYRTLYAPVEIGNTSYVLMIRQNLVETEDIISTTVTLFLVIFIFLIGGFLLSSNFISRKLWSPFKNTLQKLKDFNIADDSVPEFDQTNIREFQELNNTVNKLLSENIQAYRSQKEFTENASHELQTPIAILRSKLELLLQTENLTETQSSIVDQLYHATGRIGRINKNLVLLGKIENNHFLEEEKLDIQDVIEDLMVGLEEQASERNLQIKTAYQTSLELTANKTLVEILINNLLINSIRHNEEKGLVEISVEKDSLTITNSGEPEALEDASLFKRFTKGSKSAQSSGLGLAIVKRICDRYHWDIQYIFKENLHIFSIRF